MEADEYNEIVKNIHENQKFKLKRIQLYKVKDGKLLKYKNMKSKDYYT